MFANIFLLASSLTHLVWSPCSIGKQLLESDAIVKYLYDEYGDGKVPLSLSMGPLTTISASVGQLPRAGKVRRLDGTSRPWRCCGASTLSAG